MYRYEGVFKMSAKTNLILDTTIFTGFLVVSNPALTGFSVHEWLALTFAAAIVTHLLFHWNWLVTVTKQFFKKLFHQSRLNYLVDAVFFVAITLTMLSGILISKSVLSVVGVHLNVSHGWESVHRLTANASLAMLGLHFALHFNWVVAHIKRYLVIPAISLFKRSPTNTLTSEPVRIEKDR